MGGRRIRRSTIPAVAAATAVAAALAAGPLPPVAAPTPERAIAAPRAIAARADSFTVVATGDVLIHQDGPLVRGAAAAGKANGTGYDFRGVFTAVAPTIRAADLAVCHLETPVADPRGPFTGYPAFDVQPQIVDALQDAGYDTCSTASNHAMDAGFDGLVRTLNTLDAHGIGHTGTYRTQPERQTPHLVDVHGVRVAHIAWTFGLNGIKEPAGKPWAVNVFDPRPPTVGDMLAEAAAARRAGADVVIASVHCCTEYQADPTPAQLRIAAALLGSPDVDLVIGHHAHVVQPVERINGKWVAYGLGNHVAQQADPATNDSVITRFTFTRGSDGHFTTAAAEAIPTRIQQADDAVVVAPTPPGDASYQRVVQVLERRGGAGAGLRIVGR